MSEHQGDSGDYSSLDVRETISDVVQGGHSSHLLRIKINIDPCIQASQLTAKQRVSSVKPTVEKLAGLLYDHGLLPDDLGQLIELVTIPSFLDQASLGNIVRNLYPATPVNDDVVVRVVGCLGHGKLKPSLAIQGALLKWLVMIYHIIDNQAVLSSTYSVLFNLLDTAAIRFVRLYHYQ